MHLLDSHSALMFRLLVVLRLGLIVLGENYLKKVDTNMHQPCR